MAVTSGGEVRSFMALLTDTAPIDVTKPVGTELPGVSLRDLDEAGIDELKALVAERGVLFFRDQEMTLTELALFIEGSQATRGPLSPPLLRRAILEPRTAR